MNDMKLLAVVTPLSIYNGCSTWKTFWEEKFTQVNMKNSGRCNGRKHRDIKNGDQYVVLDISLKFGNLENMKITYSEPTYYLVIPGKGLITSLGLKAIDTAEQIADIFTKPLGEKSFCFLRHQLMGW